MQSSLESSPLLIQQPIMLETLETQIETLKNITEEQKNKIQQAIDLAREVHSGKLRRDGNNFFEGHILPVTSSLITASQELKLEIGYVEICASLLHDIAEDSKGDYSTYPSEETQNNQFPTYQSGYYKAYNPGNKGILTKIFGLEIAEIVHALTKLPREYYAEINPTIISDTTKLKYNDATPEQQKAFRRARYKEQLQRAGKRNPMVLYLKCIDKIQNVQSDLNRLNNLNGGTLPPNDIQKIKKFAEDTLNDYLEIFNIPGDERITQLSEILKSMCSQVIAQTTN